MPENMGSFKAYEFVMHSNAKPANGAPVFISHDDFGAESGVQQIGVRILSVTFMLGNQFLT